MKVIVIKCGGSTLHNLSDSFFSSLGSLRKKGYQFVFVHGGGPDIDQELQKNKIMPVFENGLRKTTKEVLDTVEYILSGKTNRALVQMLENHGIMAIGLNGSDGGLLKGDYLNQELLGSVGYVNEVNIGILTLLLSKGYTPVLTPIAITNKREKLNVNADMAAGAVAKSLQAEMCLFVTDVRGVLKNGSLIEKLTDNETVHLIEQGDISGGMIPKVETAISLLKQGVKKVMIASGNHPFFIQDTFLGTTFILEGSTLKEVAQ